MNLEFIVFIVYLICMVCIGVVFFFRDKDGSEKTYFLGNRKMGAWVAALSAGASDMSAWVLMGLPTAIYNKGLSEVWIAIGLGLGAGKRFLLLLNECVYPILSSYLLAFARAIAEVGAVSMVGGAIAWKTNVMTTAIMQYTNKGNFTLGIALGLILLTISLIINIVITLIQRRLSK